MSPVEDVAAGTVLGDRYELHEVVGSGGMASVWRAIDRVLDRPVAVKILHVQLAEDPSFLDRFKAEAMAAARLTHPNIVSVFDTGADGPIAYIVMELFVGETLADRLARAGPLEPGAAAAVTVQVLNGLQFAHEHGVVHRDMKPANVLVGADGRVKVTDFGIAKAAYAAAEDPTTTGKVLGSVPYLAPEQVQGEAIDARADVYGVGAMLYELLTGRIPFRAETDIAAAMLRLTSDPIPPRAVRPGIPRALDAIVLRALARDRDARFATAADMAAALSRFQGSATAPAEVPPQGEPVPRPGVFRSWMVVPLLAILTAAVVVVVGIAANVINSPFDGGPLGGGPSGASGSQSASGGGRNLQIVGVTSLDPFGDESEHDDQLSLATDGNAGTFWTTEGYNSPTMDKPGVGIVFDLGRQATVDGFRLQTPLPGWSFQLLVGNDPDPLAQSPTGPTLTASQSMREPVHATTGRYVVVWITRATRASDGENRAEIAEFSVLGTR
ncbi:MAG: protein kinase domain-containing protein [Actinomycetota bacterium]